VLVLVYLLERNISVTIHYFGVYIYLSSQYYILSLKKSQYNILNQLIIYYYIYFTIKIYLKYKIN